MEMEEVQNLIKTTLSEIERVLSTKAVVGEPMTVEGNTIIPLVSIGFGFGGGGGIGKSPKEGGEGGGSGAGGGGGIKPIGIIVVNKEGVKIELTKGTMVSFGERIIDLVDRAMERRAEKKKEETKEG
jgi:uncharacterized spore protein YtfJ